MGPASRAHNRACAAEISNIKGVRHAPTWLPGRVQRAHLLLCTTQTQTAQTPVTGSWASQHVALIAEKLQQDDLETSRYRRHGCRTALAMADRIPDGIGHHAGIMMFQPKSLQHCKELLWYYGDRYERGMRDIQATRPLSIDRLKAQGIGTCPPLRRASRYLGESYNY